MRGATSEGYVTYRRISDKDKQGDGFSLAAQKNLLNGYANKHPWQFLEDFEDMQTAKSPGRENFNRMVQFLKKHKRPVHLLVEKTDRLVRNLKDEVTIGELMEAGVIVHFVKEGEILSQTSTSHAKFMHGIKVLMAKNYIDNLSEEVKKGQLQKVKEGGWSWPAPYGYKNNKETKQIEPHPKATSFVKRAYELYGQGHSIQSTINRLYEEGLFYKDHSPKVSKTKLGDILKSRAYIGEIEYNGEVYQGKHEPIVSRPTWYQVQVMLKKGNKPMEMNKHDFLFKGKLTCGECGKPLVGEFKKEGKYVYYRCSAMKKGCSQGYVSESKIEKAVNTVFERLPLAEETRAEILQVIKEMEDLKENTVADEAEIVQKEINRINKNRRVAYQDKLEGVIDTAMYQEICSDYNSQMEKLEQRLSNLKKAGNEFYNDADRFLELPNVVNGAWLSGSYEDKKEILNFATSNLKIKDGKADVQLVSVLSDLLSLSTRTEWRGNPSILRTVIAKHSLTIQEIYRSLTA